MEETEIVKTQDIDEAKLKKKTAIGIILILAFLIIFSKFTTSNLLIQPILSLVLMV